MEHNNAQNQPESHPNATPEQPASTQPQPQVVQQYVVQEKSLKGLGGALIFWMIVFALYVIGSISMFTTALAGSDYDAPTKVVALLFTPFLAVAFAAAVVLIALQKKLAVLVTFVALGLAGVFSTVNSIAAFTSSSRNSDQAVPALISGILISYVILGLIALYFLVSKRVKQTLIN